MKNNFMRYFLSGVLIIWAINCLSVHAQYFGQNKPVYKIFNYKVYRTPHFEIYHYLKNDSVLNRLAQLCEQWHSIHQSLFKDTLSKNPVIFYANHADFQQTTAISGDIDVGTGGVTEALKNRVVLPIATSFAQTDHVLGHELVHAFQYHSLLSGDTGSLNNLRYLPLWMVEGMAEYLSLGSVDSNTAMWMRDAIANNDFPTLDDLTRSNKYFPYRYGECFWAMVGRTWGDSVIVPLFKETAKYGYEMALKRKFGYDERTISGMWRSALVNQYQKYLDIALTQPVGNKILFSKNAGDMNISPAVSPDGKYVIFLSEKDVFSFDLYLADAHSGKIIRKISSTIHNSEIDAFNYIESAGTWSPDGQRFAFTIFANGLNKLMIVNVKKAKVIAEYTIPGVPSFNNPAWSPVDDRIAISGMVEGQNDLFIFDLKTKKAEQITNDSYAYMEPAWSGDGKRLVFATDRPLQEGQPIDPAGAMNIGVMDLDTHRIRLFDVFNGAKNLNPVFSSDNSSVFFLSDRDGFRNLYRYSIDSAKVYQMTKFFTGISGITEYSPALSLAQNKDILNYSYFYGGKYSIYSASMQEFKPFAVKTDSINFEAATLPPLPRAGKSLVDSNLLKRIDMPVVSRDSFTTAPYHPKFRLDYITQTNAGISTSQFGTGMAGSIFAIFSDIVGQNQLFTTLAVNGEVYDFGGQIAYLNSKHKINWAVSLSHIPYLYVTYNVGPHYTTDNQVDGVNEYYDYIRLFEDQISVYAFRPLSRVRRLELGASTAWYYYRTDEETYTTYDNGLTDYSRNKISSPAGLTIQGINAAYVADNSFFGMTAPMRGYRYRFGVEKYFGDASFVGLEADYRQYLYEKPFTFAMRLYHYGRYWGNADFLSPMYLGYPWLMRGYDASNVQDYQTKHGDTTFTTNNLSGSRMALASFEVRIPFTGPKKIAMVKSGFFFTDLSLFTDIGMAWDSNSKVVLRWKPENSQERVPFLSSGVSLRFNVLGALVLEPYYAFPWQLGGLKQPVFGLNFVPGW